MGERVHLICRPLLCADWSADGIQLQTQHLWVDFARSESVVLTLSRGCRRSEDAEDILEKLFREDRYIDLGGWCYRSRPHWWLSRRVERTACAGSKQTLWTDAILRCQADVLQRLMGASLLVFKNKSDISGCMTEDEIIQVRKLLLASILVLMFCLLSKQNCID